jgi:hypothetical protein
MITSFQAFASSDRHVSIVNVTGSAKADGAIPLNASATPASAASFVTAIFMCPSLATTIVDDDG